MKFMIFDCNFGIGAQITETDAGPKKIKDLYEDKLKSLNFEWSNRTINTPTKTPQIGKDRLQDLVEFNQTHANNIKDCVNDNAKPIVLGGDHSIAIGTWSGVTAGLNNPDNFGLIWIDAHLDAHTFETSPSKAYHGMPTSHLLGHGENELNSILGAHPKIKPENLIFFGIRSYENEELELLKKLGVEIHFMEDIHKNGIQQSLQKILDNANTRFDNFGISLDLDYFDPEIAPGVGSPEPNGGDLSTLEALEGVLNNPKLSCLEIVELNPERDHNNKTSELVYNILKAAKK